VGTRATPKAAHFIRQKRKIKLVARMGFRGYLAGAGPIALFAGRVDARKGASGGPSRGLRRAVGLGGEYSTKVPQQVAIWRDVDTRSGTVTWGDGRWWTCCLLFATRSSGFMPLIQAISLGWSFRFVARARASGRRQGGCRRPESACTPRARAHGARHGAGSRRAASSSSRRACSAPWHMPARRLVSSTQGWARRLAVMTNRGCLSLRPVSRRTARISKMAPHCS
jgi:hypothetical protein